MSRILVSGLVNFETSLRVDKFPIQYEPVHYSFFAVNSMISGVGYNITNALHTLGNPAQLISIVGDDTLGQLARLNLNTANISDQYVISSMAHTAQSVILYDSNGRRQIHTDLKDVQEQHYPIEKFSAALADCDLAVLCNINCFSPSLNKLANL